MQRNVFLWLVVLLLGGALAVGNPFLPGAAVPRPGQHGAVDAGATGFAGRTPLVTPVALRTTVNADGVDAEERGLLPLAVRQPPCPDPTLQSQVIGVQRGFDGEPVWVLQDGRRLRRGEGAANGAVRWITSADAMRKDSK